jgi:hypothetical protein
VTPWWAGLLLGALGAAVADGTKIGAVMIESKKWPWSRPGQRAPFLVALLIRTTCPAVLAAVVAAQLTGWPKQAFVLFGIGLAGPTSVQQGTRFARVVVKAILTELSKSGGGQDGL